MYIFMYVLYMEARVNCYFGTLLGGGGVKHFFLHIWELKGDGSTCPPSSFAHELGLAEFKLFELTIDISLNPIGIVLRIKMNKTCSLSLYLKYLPN